MKKLLMIFALVFCAPAAFAAEAAVKPDAPAIPEQPKLTINDCLTILSGLNGLDGHSVIINQGKPNELSIIQAYKFENPNLRKAIQTDLVLVQGVQRDVDQIRQKTISELSKDGAEIQPNSSEMASFTKQMTDLGKSACTPQLTRINWDDLKLKDNEIPGTILAALDKILNK